MIGEVSLSHTFDAGHRIVGHTGKCRRLHGHTYAVEVTMRGEVNDLGFVVDFGDVKAYIDRWDHRTLLWKDDPLAVVLGEQMPNYNDREMQMEFDERVGVVRLPLNPTAENMAHLLATGILDEFASVESCRVVLWETQKARAVAEAVAMYRRQSGTQR